MSKSNNPNTKKDNLNFTDGGFAVTLASGFTDEAVQENTIIAKFQNLHRNLISNLNDAKKRFDESTKAHNLKLQKTEEIKNELKQAKANNLAINNIIELEKAFNFSFNELTKAYQKLKRAEKDYTTSKKNYSKTFDKFRRNELGYKIDEERFC